MITRTFSGRRMVRLASGLVVLAVATRVASAQSPNEQSAYVALSYTTVGGLPPLPPSTDSLGVRGGSGFVLHGRLGHMSRQGGLSLNAYGVGVEFPVGRVNVGGTLAYMSASCGELWAGDTDCAGDVMVGGTVRTTLATKVLTGSAPSPKRTRGARGARAARPANENTLLVGFDGSLGFSPRQGEQALAIAGGVPTAIVLARGGVRILPFITPGLGYGRLGNVTYFEDEPPKAHGAIAFMLGGGVGLEFGTSGVGASVGFQRVFKSSGGATQLGLGMTWRGA